MLKASSQNVSHQIPRKVLVALRHAGRWPWKSESAKECVTTVTSDLTASQWWRGGGDGWVGSHSSTHVTSKRGVVENQRKRVKLVWVLNSASPFKRFFEKT